MQLKAAKQVIMLPLNLGTN